MLSEETGDGAELQGQVIQALRAELAEYGGLLNRFDEQQIAILARDPDAVLAADENIEAQLIAARGRRKQREALVSALATQGDRPPESSLTELIPIFREPTRPLAEALIAEVNRLIGRARRRAQQNQMLLARTIEVTQELLTRLDPGTVTRTYSAQGRMKIKASARGSRLLEKS